jgi:hypothetical protein
VRPEAPAVEGQGTGDERNFCEFDDLGLRATHVEVQEPERHIVVIARER